MDDNVGARVLDTLEQVDLRDRDRLTEILTQLVNELNHSLVVFAYLSGKHPAVVANQLVSTFEGSLIGMGCSSWAEFQTLIATALEERRNA